MFPSLNIYVSEKKKKKRSVKMSRALTEVPQIYKQDFKVKFCSNLWICSYENKTKKSLMDLCG